MNSRTMGVKNDVPKMEMVHHQDMMVELSTYSLAAQREIKTLRIQLWNADATICAYIKMVDGQASDLYASDMDTWSTISSIQGSGKELAVDNHSPSESHTR
jgi:hypothetical protein